MADPLQPAGIEQRALAMRTRGEHKGRCPALVGVDARHRGGLSLSFKTSKETEEDLPDITAQESGSSSIVKYLPVILPLLLVYVSNQWSRSSLYYLVNFSDSPGVTSYTAMNLDLGFSSSQYGLLASVAFTALFAVASLIAGNLSDRSDRKFLTVSSAAAWSAATLLTAAAGDYDQVLAARIFMGLACAFSTPSAYTLIRDLVPKERSALASSVYGSGVYLGGALSSLSILLDESLGWRGALYVIGGYGLAVAALSAALLPPDPAREREDFNGPKGVDVVVKQDVDGESSPSLFDDATAVISTPLVRWLFLGSFIRFSSGLCIGVWSAPYFRLVFPDDATSYAVTNAFIVGLCGVTSGILGGLLSDRAGAAATAAGLGEKAGRLSVPVVGSILAAPAWYMTITAPTFESSMGWLAVEYLVAECWFGPVVAVLQSSVGPKRGGTAQGMFTLTGAIGNLAPSLLGILYGQATATGTVADDGSSLSELLKVGVSAGYVLSAVCFALCAQTSIQDDSIQKIVQDSSKES